MKFDRTDGIKKDTRIGSQIFFSLMGLLFAVFGILTVFSVGSAIGPLPFIFALGGLILLVYGILRIIKTVRQKADEQNGGEQVDVTSNDPPMQDALRDKEEPTV